MKTKVREAIRVIDEDTLQRVFENMKTHLNFVIPKEGRHFEYVMK